MGQIKTAKNHNGICEKKYLEINKAQRTYATEMMKGETNDLSR